MCVPVSDNINVNKETKCKPPVSSAFTDKRRTSREKKPDNYHQNTFVDAPLPKTNPWTLNRNAVQVVESKDSTSEKDPIADKITILQTQQSIGEYYY